MNFYNPEMVSLFVDTIIAMVLVEMIAFYLYRLILKRGMPSNEIVSFLGAGMGLLLAFRVLLRKGSMVWFMGAMLIALVFHLWHVRQRWQ